MGRPVYPYELGDPDFSWLISNFQENNPQFCVVEDSCLPIVFIEDATEGASSGMQLLPPSSSEDTAKASEDS